MGYSDNPKTLERRLELLAELEKGNECEWPCVPQEEPSLVFTIREALWIAAYVVPEKYPNLASAHTHFTIRTTGKGKVTATRRSFPKPRPLTSEDSFVRAISSINVANTIRTKPEGTHTFHVPSFTASDLENLLDMIGNLKLEVLLFWDDESMVLTSKPFDPELQELALSYNDLTEEQ